MHEFYSLNPKLVLRYQPFMKLRMEKLQEDTHFDGWVFGQYIAASIGANFSKKTKYPKQPYYTMQIEDDTEEEVYVLDNNHLLIIFLKLSRLQYLKRIHFISLCQEKH